MLTKALKSTYVFFILCSILSCAAKKTASNSYTNTASAQKWVKSGVWKNGLKLNVFSDVNAVEFAKQYQANKAIWDKAFIFLRDNDLASLPNGKITIDGDNLFASITEPTSKELAQTVWESHKKYIDLQYISRGKEKIGMNTMSNLTLTEPYNEAKEAAHYSGDGKYYVAEPGTFYLFFPQDPHRPSIKVDGYPVVKKVVLKIRVAGT